ncbi:MAG: hypothetical protein K0U66_05960 [Gammaproteobacteria bacterium]|nr:hypothetical protein [Gammaproteobacteria bacterium]
MCRAPVSPPPPPQTGGDSAGGTPAVQGLLPFPIKDISDAIYAAIPTKLGDKDYWRRWTTEVANIADKIAGHLNKIFAEGENKILFEDFLESLRSNLNPTVSAKDAVDMLAQHIITRPVFEMLFSDESFVKRNPVAQSLQKIIDGLDTTKFTEQTGKLRGFYESVNERVKVCTNDDKAKQELIRHLYDTFFKEGFPLMAARLGIGYTPIEVVDFILNSTSDILKQEFGRQLGDDNVHIIDPFAGTGSFIVRMLQIEGLIKEDQLTYKFRNEIHANDVLLLPYYVSLANIVTAYHARMPTDSKYEPFPGMVLADSFQLYEGTQHMLESAGFSPDNNERARQQLKTPINIVMSNPPWSIGQKLENDNNQNLEYITLDKRIRETYGQASKVSNKKALYDSYVRAIRWSSDRIGDEGIISLVTNGGWLNGTAASGIRACLAKEFDAIWVVNLRGDARTSGELRRKEKDNVFGQTTRAPVTLVILAKNPNNRHKTANILYHDIGNYLSAKEKLDILSNKRSIAGLNFQKITPDEDHDWVKQRDRRFDKFIELGSKQARSGVRGLNPVIFRLYSLGVITNRDAWAHNFNRGKVAENMRRMIDYYNEQVELRKNHADDQSHNSRALNDNDPRMISWDSTLRRSLRKNNRGKFNSEKIRLSLYRPFTLQHLYFDNQFNNTIHLQPKFFPEPASKNQVIAISGVGANEFSVLMAKCIPDVNIMTPCQCFPRYAYNKDGTREDNITADSVAAFRKHYKDDAISADDIFYYCYGLLHAPDYQDAFANNLVKQLPRLPYAKDFHAFCQAGRALAGLHMDYESVEEYPLALTGGQGNPLLGELPADAQFCRVQKMKWADKLTKKRIIYNDHISLDGIPPEAANYVVNGRTPLEWIIDRYQVKIDKPSGITNDPNQWSDDPHYIISLIKRLTRVSIETVRIIGSLPPAL